MALAVGTRVGPYEVVSAIGAGGMGEVYRARDLKLGRSVALKVLPAAFAADSDRLARFEREAQLLAALNHPHIAARRTSTVSSWTRSVEFGTEPTTSHPNGRIVVIKNPALEPATVQPQIVVVQHFDAELTGTRVN